MTREEIKKYTKKLQLRYPIDYQELKKRTLKSCSDFGTLKTKIFRIKSY